MYRQESGVSFGREIWRKLDYLQLGVIACLLIIGLIFIRSIGIQIGSETALNYFPQQLKWIAVGLAVYCVFALTDYRRIQCRVAALVLYIIFVSLLVAVLLWGKPINNACRWLVVGSFRLQPSEPAKVAIIAVLAGLFASKKWQTRRWQILTFILYLFSIIDPFTPMHP